MNGDMEREFQNPTSEYRLAPFWFLNRDLRDEELIRQIREMHEKGVDGFILHPRHGLLTPYLSEEWFERIRTCIEMAKKLDMKAYLYDENNWPSGHADGIIVEENPSFRMSGVHLVHRLEIKAGEKVSLKINKMDELIAVVAFPLQDGKIKDFFNGGILLNDFVKDDTFEWEAPSDSDFRVYVFSRKYLASGTFFGPPVDTLNPDAIKRFIELTHKEYAKRFKDEFGSTVWGIFTDEPAMDHNPPEAIPWTSHLPSFFERRFGYSLYKALPALFEDVGPLTPMVRAHFRDTATEAYVSAFFKQIYEFCDKVNLNFVGHVLSEGELYHHTRHQGDFFRGAQYMHFGGVDLLCELTWPQPDTPFGLNNLVGPKFASSAAHLLEKPRVMCEAFGLASQWGISLNTLKWLADWLIALGVNLIMPHAFYYSIQGFRKWECPPDEFYRAPFWKYYKKFADYVARLSYIFSHGNHIADVAVLYPIKSMWASITPQPTKETEKIILGFNKTSEALLRIGFDFDYISEEILQQRALFQRGRIWIMDETCSDVLEEYKVLVLPTLTMLSWETVEVIEDYLAEDGKVIALGSLPHTSFEAGEDSELLNRLSFLFGVEPEEAKLNPEGMEKKIYRKKHEKGEAIFIRGAHDLPQEELEKELFSILREIIEPDILLLEGDKPARDIVALHYMKAERSFYLFVNTSREKSVSFRAELSEGGIPLVWNAENGKLEPFPFKWQEKKGKTILDITLPPNNSLLISLEEELPQELMPKEKNTFSYEESVFLQEKWQFKTAKPNALPLRNWQYEMSSKVTGRDHDTYLHIYKTSFRVEDIPEKARLIMDGGLDEPIWRGSARKHIEVLINGEQVKNWEPDDYLDRFMFSADVSSLLKEGVNEIEIRCVAGLYEPVNLAHPPILIGNFALKRKDEGWVITREPGEARVGECWTTFGYPFYSGIATYSQKIHIGKPEGKNVVVKLEKVGELAGIKVNGELVDVRLWEPFEVDITNFVKEGENLLEIEVANTMQNLIVGEPKPSGLLGKVEVLIRG